MYEITLQSHSSTVYTKGKYIAINDNELIVTKENGDEQKFDKNLFESFTVKSVIRE